MLHRNPHPACRESLLIAVGPASTCGGKPVKCGRNLLDFQKCFLLCLQDYLVFSPSLLFSCSRAQTGKRPGSKFKKNRPGQISNSCGEEELN